MWKRDVLDVLPSSLIRILNRDGTNARWKVYACACAVLKGFKRLWEGPTDGGVGGHCVLSCVVRLM